MGQGHAGQTTRQRLAQRDPTVIDAALIASMGKSIPNMVTVHERRGDASLKGPARERCQQ